MRNSARPSESRTPRKFSSHPVMYTTPATTAGVACTGPLVGSFHLNFPVKASSAYRCMSYEPISTTSLAIVGDDFTSPPVLNDQSRLPSRTCTACSVPPRSPMKTTPFATAGDDSPIVLPVAYFQRSFPEARSIASKSPPADPTKTRPSAIAGDDSMASPASYVQCSESVEGSAPAATPVSRALPRNWVQSDADGACAEQTATKTKKSAKSATTEDTDANGGHGLVLYKKER